MNWRIPLEVDGIYQQDDPIEQFNLDRLAALDARLLAQRGSSSGNSRYSWTEDLAVRRAKARETREPLLAKAASLKDEVIDLKEQLKRLKKTKAGETAIETIDAQIREKDKHARDLEAQAASLDAAVFDLKAVNPTAVMIIDERTPIEIIQNIQDQGRIVSEALARLSDLISSPRSF